MTILQINATYGLGSTGNIVRDIKHCCEDNGIRCYVAYQKTAEKDAGYKIGNCISKYLHSFLCRLEGKEAYYSSIATRKLLHYIEDLQPDIVHLHNLHNHYINLNLLLDYLAKSKIKTVITMHDCWFYTGGCFHYANADCLRWQHECGKCPLRYQATPAYLYDASSKVLFDRKSHLSAIDNLTVVGASKWIADEAKKSFLSSKNVCYIHNGFNLSVFKPTNSDIRQKFGLMNKQVILGPTAKWLDKINQPTLNHFISQMNQNQVLVLFGPGKVNQPLPTNVIIYGYTNSKDELAQLYSMADVFVNCSREDTLSSINLEAQACGTPVITYDATGSKETVCDGSGFAVSTGDYQSLWDKTNEILLNGKTTYTNQCRTFIEQEFELSKNYYKYIELYKSLMNE